MSPSSRKHTFRAGTAFVLCVLIAFAPSLVNAQAKPAEKSKDALLEEQVRRERERNRLLREKRAANQKRLRDLRVKRIQHELSYRRYRRAFGRGLFFPGLGQWMLDKKWKSGMFIGGGILLLGNLFTSWNAWQAAGADYNNQEVPVAIAAAIRSTDAVAVNSAYFQERRAALETARGNLNIALLLAAGLYFYNLYDITRENPVRTEPAKAARRVMLTVTPEARAGRNDIQDRHTRLDFQWHLRF